MSESNGYVTREELLGKPYARRYAIVEVRGKRFRLRSLSAGEANLVASKHLACEDEEDRARALASLPCRYIAQCVCDGDGHRIFSDLDIAKLMDLDAGLIEELAQKCQQHSGVNSKGVEGAEKNSEPTPASALPTG